MIVKTRFTTALVAALLALPVMGVSLASATWFNWYNGVVGSGGQRAEGVNHHTYATENDQTGIWPCTGVSDNYYYCSGNSNSIRYTGYALGDPLGGNNDTNSHYDHLWWCSGSC